MKELTGVILSWDPATQQGEITGDDGQVYDFSTKHWTETEAPVSRAAAKRTTGAVCPADPVPCYPDQYRRLTGRPIVDPPAPAAMRRARQL